MDADPREGKLPVWAQLLIEKLRRDKETAETMWREAQMETDPDESLLIVENTYGNELGLPKFSRVSWRPEKPAGKHLDYPSLSVYRSSENGGVIVVQADETLLIEPRASNTVYLRMRER